MSSQDPHMPQPRMLAAPLRRLRVSTSGPTAVGWAILVCLAAAALVAAVALWHGDAILVDWPAPERIR